MQCVAVRCSLFAAAIVVQTHRCADACAYSRERADAKVQTRSHEGKIVGIYTDKQAHRHTDTDLQIRIHRHTSTHDTQIHIDTHRYT